MYCFKSHSNNSAMFEKCYYKFQGFISFSCLNFVFFKIFLIKNKD